MIAAAQNRCEIVFSLFLYDGYPSNLIICSNLASVCHVAAPTYSVYILLCTHEFQHCVSEQKRRLSMILMNRQRKDPMSRNPPIVCTMTWVIKNAKREKNKRFKKVILVKKKKNSNFGF